MEVEVGEAAGRGGAEEVAHGLGEEEGELLRGFGDDLELSVVGGGEASGGGVAGVGGGGGVRVRRRRLPHPEHLRYLNSSTNTTLIQ